jgi:putative FmdB family regulatory protein
MPVYEYRCPRGHVTELYRPFAQYRDPLTCQCGEAAEKVVLSPPKVFGDYEGYESPASGKWIEGRRAREEDFKRTGTRPYDPGEKEELPKRIAAAERQLDATIDAAVDQTLAELTS